MQITGKTALLTGATGGLGRAIALALAQRGATLVLSSRKADELEQLAGSLPGEGHRTVVSELGSDGSGEKLIAAASEHGRPRHLRRQCRASRQRPARGSERRGDHPGAERQPRGADPGDAGRCCRACSSAAPGTSSTSPRLPARCRRRGRRCTTPPSSACAASPLPCARTCATPVSAPRWCCRASSAMPACSPTPRWQPPPGMGTSTPEAVGAGVVKAIESDKAEFVVAPPQARFVFGNGVQLPVGRSRRPARCRRADRRGARLEADREALTADGSLPVQAGIVVDVTPEHATQGGAAMESDERDEVADPGDRWTASWRSSARSRRPAAASRRDSSSPSRP